MNPGAAHSMRGFISPSQPVRLSGLSMALLAEQWVVIRCCLGMASMVDVVGVVDGEGALVVVEFGR